MNPRLKEIRERLERATPRPWCWEAAGEKGDGSNFVGIAYGPDDEECDTPLSGELPAWDDDGEEIDYYRDEEVAECAHRNRNAYADADFIANAPTDVAFLLDYVAFLEQEMQEMVDAHREAEQDANAP